ncbi:MAG TPA: TRAP transporter substrate-binding protein [Chloroflexota bacterium]|nr:TRAP transporter substrate-binding protein [Chloroflexota bacterium]
MTWESREYSRRGILRLGLLGAASGLLVGCGQAAPSSSQPTSASAPAAKTGKVFTGSLANAHEPGNIIYKTHEEFVKLIKAKTNGEVDIKVVGSSQLGAGRNAIEAVQAGSLEFTHATNSYLGAFDQARLIFDLPFIFRDADHMKKVMDGPIGQEFTAATEKKMDVTLYMDGMVEGPRVTFNRARPIVTPKDFQGLKIRVMENPINLATFKAMGANPVPMAIGELYLALQQGTVDGAENAQVNILAGKWHEVAKFISRTNHLNAPIQLVASNKWLATLGADHKKAIGEAAKEAMAWQRAQWDDAVKAAEAGLEKEGAQFNSPELAPFRDVVASVWSEYEDKVGGKAKIQAVLDVK